MLNAWYLVLGRTLLYRGCKSSYFFSRDVYVYIEWMVLLLT